MNSLLPQRSFRDSDSNRVIDLVVFYQYLYEYWYHRGKWPALAARLVDFINCVILWALVFVMALMLDWEQALGCDGAECGKVPLIHSPQWPQEHNIAAFVFLAACGAAALWELRRVIEGHYLLKEVHQYMRHVMIVGTETPLHTWYYRFRAWYHSSRGGHQLLEDESEAAEEARGGGASATTGRSGGVRLPYLDDISWSEYLRLVTQKLQNDKGITDYRTIDELKVVQTMMLVDNYHVALHHHGILSQVPLCFADQSTISFLVESQMLGYRIRQGEDAEKQLKEKLFVRTLLFFLAYPFVVSFMLTKFLVKSVAEVRTNPKQLAERVWSNTATWRFRLYNEVPHLASARLRKGNDVANDIISRAGGSQESPALRVIQRTSASVLLIIVIVSTINTALLNYGVVFGRTLFWWLTLAAVAFGASAGAAVVDREYNHAADLKRLAAHLHYDTPSWHRSPSAFVTELCAELLPRKLYTMVVGITSVILTPLLLLWIHRSASLQHLVHFMQQHNTVVQGIGSICTASTFNLRHRGGSSADLIGLAEQHYQRGTAASSTDVDEALHNEPSPSAGVAVTVPGSPTQSDVAASEADSEMDRWPPVPPRVAVPSLYGNPGAAPANTATLSMMGGMESFEWKVEKSLVSFAAIYPSWLERQQNNTSDDLGVNAFLREIEARLRTEVNVDAELEELHLSPRRHKTTAPSRQHSTGEHSARPNPSAPAPGALPDSSDGASALDLDGSTAHDREAANVGLMDALYRSTWMSMSDGPAHHPTTVAPSSGPTRGGGLSQMFRVGSYGSARERDPTELH